MVRKLYRVLYIVMIVLPFFTYAQPVANFSANVVSGCSPIVVHFSDLSTGSPTSWSWDLGNGSTSTLQNPSTTYITAGTYTVSLTATNSGGSNTKTLTSYITVNPSPVVNFTADSTPSCPPKTVAFTNQTVPGSSGTTTYLWDFGDGQTSSLANPSHTYTTAANFTVTLLVTNSAGCSKTLTKNNYIQLSKPQAGFTASNINSCTAPLTASFTNTSSNAISYSWDFGDGQTSTQTSPSHTYTTTGSYNVRLIATNANGCADTMLQTAYVNVGALKSIFTASDTTICAGDSVSFVNTSTLSPVTSLWKFGDGATATATDAGHIYNVAGTYTAKLIVQKNGCTDSSQKTIVVASKPTSQFTANNLMSCTAPFSTQFSNTSSGATSYFWIFGDGTTSTQANPSKTYNTAGIYTVKLVAINAAGCTDTFVRTNYIIIQPLVDSLFLAPWVNPLPGCAPATTTVFANTSPSLLLPVTSYNWNFGDGQTLSGNFPTPAHTWSTAGTYTVSLTYNTIPGCSYTKTTTFTMGTKPTASFPATPDSVCPNSLVQFTNNSSGATSYLWYYGDGTSSGNPGHTYTASGDYTVMLVAFNSLCSDTMAIAHRVFVKLPTAAFTPSYNCSNRFLYTFTDNSAGANTYSWNFGDGQTSTQSGSVTHQYATNGNYTATLTVTNAATGCSDNYSASITIFPLNSSFTANDTVICRNQQVIFTPSSNITYAYDWFFGDGGTANAGPGAATHAYSTAGQYTVKLRLTDANGCKDSTTKTNYITVGGPTVAFTATPANGCAPLTTTLLDQSTSSVGAISTRAWAFGDGGSLNTGSTSVSHTYASGTYDVKLKVTDVNGCIDSLTKPAYISASKPTAGFSTSDTNVCAGQLVSFTNTSGGNGISELWNFGDNQTSTSYSVTHSYSAVGNYTVKLIITDANNCKDSMVKPSYIHVLPMSLHFTMSDSFASCPPLAVNFAADTGLINYNWTFGNNGISNLVNPSTIYTYPGVYTVKLKAQNIAGCADSVTKTVTILGPTGSLSYSPVSGCNPVTVNFTSVNNNTQSLVWDMSNGVTQSTTSSSFSYTYTQSGKYLPKLILSDGTSCNVPIVGTDTIKVDSLGADFNFGPSNLCQSGAVQFIDTVYYSISSPATHNWTFGDGGTSTAHNPAHNYTGPGNYQVKLIISNNNGCTDTIIKTVIIHAQPTVSAGANQSLCLGQTPSVPLQATGATSYIWSPATGLTCTNCANPSASPTTTTVYTVIGTDTNGCMDTSTVTVAVNTPPTVSAGNNQSMCPGDSVQLQATGATAYTWSPSTGLTCSNCANPFAKPGSTTTYTVTGTDANGCTDTGVVTVTVHAIPNVTASGNTSACVGDSVQLQAFGATSYSWSPATGLSCTGCANPKASPGTTTTYTVTGTSVNGCKDTGIVTITINPLPNVSAGSNKDICAGGSAQLQATGATTYTWTPTTGLSCTNCANPTASPSATTTYTVTGTNANGCIDTGVVIVTVHALPNVSAGNNQSMCPGDSVQLQATGATTYTWSPSTGLTCSNCANPFAKPGSTTTYTVTGTDANGCTDTGVVTVTVHAIPNVTASGNTSACIGDSVQLQAFGATSYSWSPATGLSCTGCANPKASPGTTTTYTVTGTSVNGCKDTGIVIITINPLPNVSAGSNKDICAGSSAQLQATGATTYTWTPTTGLSCTNCANPTASPSATTTYTVTGTNANGCIDTGVVIVTVHALPNVSAGSNQSVCAGSSIILTATGASTYTWTPSTGLSCTNCASPTATINTTTTYTVTGVDANGCSDTGVVTITNVPQPTVSAGTNKTICIGSSTQLTATGATSYAWSPATGLSCTNCPNPNANPATTTTYSVIGTQNGCTDTAQVTVTVNPLPTISAGPNQDICIGSSTTLQATGGVSYSWTPATGLSCTNCANPTASPAITTTYTVTGTNANGCSNTATIIITVNPIPVVTASTTDDTICDGTTTTLQATGATSYTWGPASNLSCSTCATTTASPNSTTTYIVTGTTNGCSDTGKVTITVLPKPNITVSPDAAVCVGISVPLQAAGGQNYIWSPATGLSCTNCANPVADPATTTTYVVTGTDGNGCANTATVTVTIHQAPHVDAGEDKTLCSGSSVTLNATGAANYAWSPADNLSCTNCSSPVANPTVNKTYKVVGVDGYGCSDSDEVNIVVIEKNPVSFGPDASICIGGSAELSASGGTSYQWIPATGLNNDKVPNPIASPGTTTTYNVLVKQGDCFADTGKITVAVHNLPTVDAGPDQTAIAGNTVQLRALGTGIATYLWAPADNLTCSNCSDPVATMTRTTTYTVTVANEWGCKAEDNVTVVVTCDKSQIFIANTFTPNGDGINDLFYPQGKGISAVQRFRVFNRWGEIVFDANNIPLNEPNYGWDGTLKKAPLKPDVFVYIVNATCESGEPIEIKGDISLIR